MGWEARRLLSEDQRHELLLQQPRNHGKLHERAHLHLHVPRSADATVNTATFVTTVSTATFDATALAATVSIATFAATAIAATVSTAAFAASAIAASAVASSPTCPARRCHRWDVARRCTGLRSQRRR